MESIREESPFPTVVDKPTTTHPPPPLPPPPKTTVWQFEQIPVPANDHQSRILAAYGSPPIRQVQLGQLLSTTPGAVDSNIAACIQARSWRSLAEYCRHLILSSTISTSTASAGDAVDGGGVDVESLWFLRLTSLLQLSMGQLASLEWSTNRALVIALRPLAVFEMRLLDCVLPVLALPSPSSGDQVVVGGLSRDSIVNQSLDKLYAMLGVGSAAASTSSSNVPQLSDSQKCRVRVSMANVLLAVGDYHAASRCLMSASSSVSSTSSGTPPGAKTKSAAAANGAGENVWTLSLIGRLEIQLGNISSAQRVFTLIESSLSSSTSSSSYSSNPGTADDNHDLLMQNRALIAISAGDWTSASTLLSTLVASNPQNWVAINNLAIAMLYTGKLQEAVSLLQSLALSDGETNVGCGLNWSECILFNLTTLFELASESPSADCKARIVQNVASMGGDSFAWDSLKIL